jgi:hypothetical protein
MRVASFLLALPVIAGCTVTTYSRSGRPVKIYSLTGASAPRYAPATPPGGGIYRANPATSGTNYNDLVHSGPVPLSPDAIANYTRILDTELTHDSQAWIGKTYKRGSVGNLQPGMPPMIIATIQQLDGSQEEIEVFVRGQTVERICFADSCHLPATDEQITFVKGMTAVLDQAAADAKASLAASSTPEGQAQCRASCSSSYNLCKSNNAISSSAGAWIGGLAGGAYATGLHEDCGTHANSCLRNCVTR